MTTPPQTNTNPSDNGGSRFRPLTSEERETLIDNENTVQSWDLIRVYDSFNPTLVTNCRFYGNITIGAMKEGFLQHNDFSLPFGLYNSTFIDCTIGHFVSINNLKYCSNCLIGNEVIILNVDEISNTHDARFGNGGKTENDPSTKYTWIQLINENGGRKILPFKGMLCADAFLWSKHRDDTTLLRRFEEITDQTVCSLLGCKGQIADGATISNSKCIRNTVIGNNAIIDNSDLISNCTIQSDDLEKTTIGTSVILQNSIIGFGCSIQSGAQLQSVVTGNGVSVSQVSRISHSFIADNSAIACCEIAHSLILPSHAQHHNNSFLIASMIGGQSNLAAGATVGSNHNSRMNDGEIWANRGFWPGLCTSFKHNSKFASFTMCAKADYPFEINNPFPFSLIANDQSKDRLIIFPAYWFTHNMYAFMRSRFKFSKRDKRIHPGQIIEHDPLAPDTISEIFSALEILERYAGMYKLCISKFSDNTPDQTVKAGHEALLNSELDDIEIHIPDIEKGKRPLFLKNISQAWHMYRNIIYWYSVKQIVSYPESFQIQDFNHLTNKQHSWINCGGQIWRKDELDQLIDRIKYDDSIRTWPDVHQLYVNYNSSYNHLKLQQAFTNLIRLNGSSPKIIDRSLLLGAFEIARTVCSIISENTENSRKKDYTDPFRTCVYDSDKEMSEVLGDFSDDSTINEVKTEQNLIIEKINLYQNRFLS